jgi:hypothetical protein
MFFIQEVGTSYILPGGGHTTLDDVVDVDVVGIGDITYDITVFILALNCVKCVQLHIIYVLFT